MGAFLLSISIPYSGIDAFYILIKVVSIVAEACL